MPELVELIQADVTDGAAVAAAVKPADVERIVHLAAFIDPDMGTLPYQSFRINTLGTVNIFEASSVGEGPARRRRQQPGRLRRTGETPRRCRLSTCRRN